MRHWLTQVVLMAACLLFVAKLPALGSLAAALLASCLAVATVGAACAAADLLAPATDGAERQAHSHTFYRAPERTTETSP